MSYVRIVDILITNNDNTHKVSEILERRINNILSNESPNTALDVKILNVTEYEKFNMVEYKVFMLFSRDKGE